MARKTGSRRTNRRPSLISALMWRRSPRSGTASGVRIRESRTADTTWVAAWTETVATAPASWTRPPPRVGPASRETALVLSSRALPSTRFSRPTTTGMYDW